MFLKSKKKNSYYEKPIKIIYCICFLHKNSIRYNFFYALCSVCFFLLLSLSLSIPFPILLLFAFIISFSLTLYHRQKAENYIQTLEQSAFNLQRQCFYFPLLLVGNCYAIIVTKISINHLRGNFFLLFHMKKKILMLEFQWNFFQEHLLLTNTTREGKNVYVTQAN